MNFDFLKNLDVISMVYKPCSDAESFAKCRPGISMTQSRKGAELLAKLVYVVARAQETERIPFSELLADPSVRSFFNDNRVLNAFHFIRKCGNQATHEDCNANPNLAVTVLKNLHFVVGETAKKLKLLTVYPEFDENSISNVAILVNPDTNYNLTDEDKQRIISYCEQNNLQDFCPPVKFSLKNPAHRFSLSHSRFVEFHEYITFNHQPFYQTTLELLQSYITYLDRMSTTQWETYSLSESSVPLTFQITITIDDKIAYPCGGSVNLQDVITNQLSSAKSFSIDLTASGDTALPIVSLNQDDPLMFDETNPWQGRGLADHLEGLKRRESFTYKGAFYYGNANCSTDFFVINNGKTYDVASMCKPYAANRFAPFTFHADWLTMYVDCDHQAFQGYKEPLRNAVRAYIGAAETENIQWLWDEEDEDNTFGYLLSATQIEDADLSKSQRFADEINKILEPIAKHCTIYMDYAITRSETATLDPAMPNLAHCFYDKEHFAVASFIWEDQKLQLVASIL